MAAEPILQNGELEVIRVLLVEDDPDDVFLLRETLADVRSVQFDVSHAGRLADACTVLREQPFEVVLLDLSLPDSHGFETFDTIRETDATVPIVVLTGLDDERLALKAVQKGAQDYLVKGVADGEVLIRSIRYAIERQRTTQYQSLIAERRRFDTAVSQMTDGIVVTDESWLLTTTNRAARLLLNLPEDQWRNKTLEEALRPFALTTPMNELWTSRDRVTAFDITRTTSGPPLVVDARLTRQHDAQGQMTNAVLMLRDVTDERRAAHVKADFLSIVSHKVRTPLTVLIGYLGLCKKLPPDRLAEQWQELINTCDTEAHRLSDLLQALLELRNLEMKNLGALHGAAEVQAALDSCASQVRDRYADAEIEVTSEVAPGAERVDANPDHLKLVLESLLDNAVKFAEEHPARIHLEVKPQEDNLLAFAVADNGPGIPHEYLDRVFDEFVQVEDLTTGKVPGLGVGLRMAKQLVEAYGGEITIESTLGQGTTARFTFPAASEADAPVP